MSQVRGVLVVVRLAVRRVYTKPGYLISALVLPLAAVLMLGVVIGPGTRPLAVGVVGGREGVVGPRVRAALDDDEAVKVKTYRSAEALRAAIQRGDVLAGMVFDGAEPDTRPAQVYVDPSRPAGAAARLSMVAAADRAGTVVQAARFATAQSSASLASSLAEADRLAEQQRQIQVDARYPEGTVPRGQYDYGVVGTLVLFMFITAVSGGALLVDARRRGLTGRLVATELRPGTVLVAEVLSRYVTVLIQAAIVVAFGALLFDIRWGPPGLVAVVIAVYALVGAAAGIAVGVVARTFEQAILFGSVGAVTLGMLGGCLWPLELTPPALRALARFTPQHWAIESLLRLVGRSSPQAGLGTGLFVLGAFAAVAMAGAAVRLRKVAVG